MVSTCYNDNLFKRTKNDINEGKKTSGYPFREIGDRNHMVIKCMLHDSINILDLLSADQKGKEKKKKTTLVHHISIVIQHLFFSFWSGGNRQTPKETERAARRGP
jgi:hypothetical protein